MKHCIICSLSLMMLLVSILTRRTSSRSLFANNKTHRSIFGSIISSSSSAYVSSSCFLNRQPMLLSQNNRLCGSRALSSKRQPSLLAASFSLGARSNFLSHNVRRSVSDTSTNMMIMDDDDSYDDGDTIEDYDLIEEETIIENVVHTASSSTIDPEDDTATTTSTSTILSKSQQIEQLKQQLKQYRVNQSQPLKKPAYTIFTNAALDGICTILPTSYEELLEVKGIGKKKLELYGDDILGIVKDCINGSGGVLSNSNNNGDGNGSDTSGSKTTKVEIPEPTLITLQSLTAEQRLAAEKALDPINPSNVMISGAAGTGKSHVSKYIIQQLHTVNDDDTDSEDDEDDTEVINDDTDENDVLEIMKSIPTKRKVAAVAPTGVAAINIGGSTLHSFFGIGLGITSTNTISSVLKKVRGNKEAMRRITETDVLLIDEVSMLSSDLLELLDVVARTIRKVDDKPMGGMQVICVGDFFQLPPIVQQDRMMNYGDDAVDNYRPFCFDSPIWEELGLHENTIELSQVQRQQSGSKFEVFLNDMVRVGNVPWQVLRDFNRKCLISDEHPLPDDGIVPTRIYTHNRNVDSENEARLAELDGELISFKAIDKWREEMPKETLASIKKGMKVSVAAELPDDVELKIGAQVMLTRNKDLDRGLVNGSRGVVQDFHSFDKLPVVRFDNGRVERINRVEAVRYNPDGGPGVLIRMQLPLKLAWATTVHKSQGSTLTRAILDISNTFEAGQAYVSLSRVKDIQGLYLERTVTLDNIQVSRRVLEYYQRVGERQARE